MEIDKHEVSLLVGIFIYFLIVLVFLLGLVVFLQHDKHLENLQVKETEVITPVCIFNLENEKSTSMGYKADIYLGSKIGTIYYDRNQRQNLLQCILDKPE